MADLVRRDMIAVLQDLPEFCASRLNTTGQPILLKRGHRGYWPTRHDLNVETFNESAGVTAAQIEAMQCGSMCGFDVPGADPLNYPNLAEACEFPAALVAKWKAALADGSWVEIYDTGRAAEAIAS